MKPSSKPRTAVSRAASTRAADTPPRAKRARTTSIKWRCGPCGVSGFPLPLYLGDRGRGESLLTLKLLLHDLRHLSVERVALAGGLLLRFIVEKRLPLFRQVGDLLGQVVALGGGLLDLFELLLARQVLKVLRQLFVLQIVELDSVLAEVTDEIAAALDGARR